MELNNCKLRKTLIMFDELQLYICAKYYDIVTFASCLKYMR